MKRPKRPNLLRRERLRAAPVQSRGVESRARWKAAALAVLARRGYEATSIEEIADSAGLAIGGFYQHFQSKRQLLRVLMDDLVGELSAVEIRADGDVDLRRRVERLLIDVFATDLRYVGAYRAWQEAASSDRTLAADSRRIHAWTTARVAQVFRTLRRHPRARKRVDVQAIAALMDTVFWSLLAQQLDAPPAVRNRSLRAAAHLICHALFLDTALQERRRGRR